MSKSVLMMSQPEFLGYFCGLKFRATSLAQKYDALLVHPFNGTVRPQDQLFEFMASTTDASKCVSTFGADCEVWFGAHLVFLSPSWRVGSPLSTDCSRGEKKKNPSWVEMTTIHRTRLLD